MDDLPILKVHGAGVDAFAKNLVTIQPKKRDNSDILTGMKGMKGITAKTKIQTCQHRMYEDSKNDSETGLFSPFLKNFPLGFRGLRD